MLKGGYASEAMEYAKRGVPDSMRPGVWRVILGLPKVVVAQLEHLLQIFLAEPWFVCGLQRARKQPYIPGLHLLGSKAVSSLRLFAILSLVLLFFV